MYVPSIMALAHLETEECKISEAYHKVNETKQYRPNPYKDAAAEMIWSCVSVCIVL